MTDPTEGLRIALIAKLTKGDLFSQRLARQTVADLLPIITDAMAEKDARIVAADAEADRQAELAKVYRRAQLTAEERLCREQANAKGWKIRAQYLERAALENTNDKG